MEAIKANLNGEYLIKDGHILLNIKEFQYEKTRLLICVPAKNRSAFVSAQSL